MGYGGTNPIPRSPHNFPFSVSYQMTVCKWIWNKKLWSCSISDFSRITSVMMKSLRGEKPHRCRRNWVCLLQQGLSVSVRLIAPEGLSDEFTSVIGTQSMKEHYIKASW